MLIVTADSAPVHSIWMMLGLLLHLAGQVTESNGIWDAEKVSGGLNEGQLERHRWFGPGGHLGRHVTSLGVERWAWKDHSQGEGEGSCAISRWSEEGCNKRAIAWPPLKAGATLPTQPAPPRHSSAPLSPTTRTNSSSQASHPQLARSISLTLLVRQLLLVRHRKPFPPLRLAPPPPVTRRRDFERQEDGRPVAATTEKSSLVSVRTFPRALLVQLASTY